MTHHNEANPVFIPEVTLAPINNKPGAGTGPKRGAGLQGKSSSSSKGPSPLGGGKSSNSGTKPSSGKSLFPTSSGAGKSTSYESNAYRSSKSNKTAFGIIWLPTRKHNKQKKDMVYNPHRDDGRTRDRSPSMYNLMSGDSPDNLPRKKDEEATLLMPERAKAPAPPVPAVAAVAAVAITNQPQSQQLEPAASENADEKTEFIQRDKENKEAAGDSIDDKDDKDYLDNDDIETNKTPKGKAADKNYEKNKLGDKVDSVFLRPPPPHKARSTSSTATEEEDCGVKCLYYTLQCCDCVLM